jgi:hypothetical protein
MTKYGRSIGTATATAAAAGGIYLQLQCQLLHLLHSTK